MKMPLLALAGLAVLTGGMRYSVPPAVSRSLVAPILRGHRSLGIKANASTALEFRLDSVSPRVNSPVAASSTFRAWIRYRIPNFTPHAWATLVVIESTTLGQHVSARTPDPDAGMLSDSMGSVLVEQKFDSLWADPRFRHPFRLRVLLLHFSDEYHSRSAAELGPFRYPLAR